MCDCFRVSVWVEVRITVEVRILLRVEVRNKLEVGLVLLSAFSLRLVLGLGWIRVRVLFRIMVRVRFGV